MTVTMDQVLEALDTFEPKYDEASRLGSEALPHLETLVKGEDLLLASKAAYLVTLIENDRSLPILQAATKSKFSQVRYAVASGSQKLRIPGVDEVLDLLKDDNDPVVRKRALKSIELRRNHG